MKKKFVLTLALVLMVAATLGAAPIDVKGDFKAGYKLTLTSPKAIAPTDKTEAQANVIVSSGDFWEMEFADIVFTGDNDSKGTLTVNLDKALAEKGVDMGDVTLSYSIGNTGTVSSLFVYKNSQSNYDDARAKMVGDYSSSVTLGYAKMVTLLVGADLASFDTANKPFIVSAKLAPVDGISAAVGYSNYANGSVDGAIDGSVMIDVAKLAGLDFSFSVSAADVYLLTSKTNKLYVEANGAYKDIAAWVEYQMIGADSNLNAKVTYSGIKDVSLNAKVSVVKLAAPTTTISAGASYKMGGVTYALDGAYVLNGAFTLTPTVAVSF